MSKTYWPTISDHLYEAQQKLSRYAGTMLVRTGEQNTQFATDLVNLQNQINAFMTAYGHYKETP